jgi:hypothetical protein
VASDADDDRPKDLDSVDREVENQKASRCARRTMVDGS